MKERFTKHRKYVATSLLIAAIIVAVIIGYIGFAPGQGIFLDEGTTYYGATGASGGDMGGMDIGAGSIAGYPQIASTHSGVRDTFTGMSITTFFTVEQLKVMITGQSLDSAMITSTGGTSSADTQIAVDTESSRWNVGTIAAMSSGVLLTAAAFYVLRRRLQRLATRLSQEITLFGMTVSTWARRTAIDISAGTCHRLDHASV